MASNSDPERGGAGADVATAGEAVPTGTSAEPGEPTSGTLHEMTSGAREMAGQVRTVAEDLTSQLPAMAATTRDVMGQAARQMETSSTEMLIAATTLSIGLALGLLIGGANRLLVAIALLPAAAMGATLLDRQGRASGTSGATGRH